MDEIKKITDIMEEQNETWSNNLLAFTDESIKDSVPLKK